MPHPSAPPSIWSRWSRLRILALAALLLVSNFAAQLLVYALTGELVLSVLGGGLLGTVLPLAALVRGGVLEPRADLAWRVPSWREALFTAGIALAAVPPVSLLAELSLRLHPVDPEWVRRLNEQLPHDAGGIVLAVAAMVVTAPLVEEVVFRALVHRLASRLWGGVPAAVVSSLVFGLAHLEPWFVLGLVGVGLMLALVWESTHSLVACWLAHAVHNAFSLALLLVTGVTATPSSPQVLDLALAAGGLVLVGVLGRALRRR